MDREPYKVVYSETELNKSTSLDMIEPENDIRKDN